MRGPTVGVLVVVAVLSACSAPESASSRFPSRPGDLPVGESTACETLSEAQREILDVGPGTVDPSDATDPTASSCSWGSDQSRFWSVRVQPHNPIGQFDPDDPLFVGRSQGYQDPQITVVDGYGAVQFQYSLTGSDPSCNLAIDAAANATVVLTYSDNVTDDPNLPTTGIEQRCEKVAQLASMVITTLRSRAAG